MTAFHDLVAASTPEEWWPLADTTAPIPATVYDLAAIEQPSANFAYINNPAAMTVGNTSIVSGDPAGKCIHLASPPSGQGPMSNVAYSPGTGTFDNGISMMVAAKLDDLTTSNAVLDYDLGDLCLWVKPDGSVNAIFGFEVVANIVSSAPGLVGVGVAHLFAVSYDPVTGAAAIYLDGNLVGSATIASTAVMPNLYNGHFDLNYADDGTFAGWLARGSFQHWVVWRRAITATEVSQFAIAAGFKAGVIPYQFRRWTFKDTVTSETVTLPFNPDSMTSPFLQQSTTRTPVSPIDGMIRASRVRTPPREWSFSGPIRTQLHHDLLLAWSARKSLMEVTDHLNRTFLVRFVQFSPDEKKPTKKTPWRFKYTMRCLSYGRKP